MAFDARRLRAGELLAGTGAVVLFVAMFVDWYGVRISTARLGSIQIPAASADAWSAFTVVDLVLAATVASALALVFLQATRRSPALPVSFSVVTTVLGAVTVLAILYRIIDPPGIDLPGAVGAIIAPHLQRTVEGGAYVGLVGAFAIAAGAWRSMRVEGVAAADERTAIETVALDGGGL
jgi:hypothetical protein